MTAQEDILRPTEAEPGEGAELTAHFTRVLPGHVFDDTAYEQIETALDRAEAPCQADDGRWLKLHERIAALAAANATCVEAAEAMAAALAEMKRALLSPFPKEAVVVYRLGSGPIAKADAALALYRTSKEG